MIKKDKNLQSNRLLELVVLFSILLLFVGTALAVVLVGAKSYKLIGHDMESNFSVRTPIAYIATKIRQNDRLGSVKVESLGEQSALVLEENIEGTIYEAWIYAYEGQMREVYIEKGTAIAPEDGMEIIAVNDLKVELSADGLLDIQVENQDGKVSELTISFRAIEEGRRK